MAGFLVQLKPLFTNFPEYLGDNLIIQMHLFSVSSVCIGFISQLIEVLKKLTLNIITSIISMTAGLFDYVKQKRATWSETPEAAWIHCIQDLATKHTVYLS